MKDFFATIIALAIGMAVIGFGWGISIACGVVTFTACNIMLDEMFSGRSRKGAWKRQRKNIAVLAGAFILGLLVFGVGQNPLWTMGATILGLAMSKIVIGMTPWGRDEFEKSDREAIVWTLVSAAMADGEFSVPEGNQIADITRRLMCEVGYADDIDTLPIVREARMKPYGKDQFKYLVAPLLQKPLAANFWKDLGRVLFADGEMNPKEKVWLDSFLKEVKVTDTGFMRLFSREYVIESEHRTACLKMVGLPTDATQDQISEAYNSRIESIQGEVFSLPEQANRLMNKQRESLEAAYGYLKDSFATGGLLFRLSDGTAAKYHGQDPFQCICWNCNSQFHLTKEHDLQNLRCSQCHALAGLSPV